jgi:beta-galactosidase
MENFLYGVAYYDEYMPYDRLEQDIAMMKEANINVVRIAESTWSTLEIREGEYNFYHIDRVLDAMEKSNIYVIIGTPTYAIPSWLANKDKDILVSTKNGDELYGRRQNMDITNKTFLYYAEKIIRVLIEHTANRKGVIGFQIDNETKHYGTAGAHVQQLFKEYLKEKFKTVEALNQEFGFSYWSNSIGSWDDLPDVRGTINASYACEFEKFQRQLVSEYLAWQATIVREYKRENQFITHNFDFEWKKFGASIAQDGYSYGVQPDVNHYEAARCLTIAGTDIYHMTQDELTGAEIAFGGDLIRSLKQDNYLVLETQAQAFKNWVPYPGQLRLQAFSHIASGAIGVMYWNWHSIHNSYETYWKGLLSHDLQSNPTYEESKVIGRELKELKNELLHLKKINKVAVLVSNEALTSLKWFPIDKDLSYNDVVRWMYDSLYKLNIECDVIFTELDDFEQYKTIIVPALYSVNESVLNRLSQFVKNGGVLIASFKTAVSDEHVTVYHDNQPHILNECFGITYNQFVEPKNVTLSGIAPDKDTNIKYWMEFLKPDKAEVIASYNHKYWGNYAAITKNSYGKGKAIYIGCYTSEEVLQEVYKLVFRECNLDHNIQNELWPIIIRKGIGKDGKQIYFYMNYSSEDREVICPYDKVNDLLTGDSYKSGGKISLKDWDVKILKEID